MKALVLTFDKYKPFAEHMILCYEQLWPNHPFTFRVPYQDEAVKNYFEKKFGNKVEMIKSPSGIVDTMFALSDDLDEKEWIYWCMDDRYLIKPNKIEFDKAYRLTQSSESNDMSGICLGNSPNCWLSEHKYDKRYSIKTSEGQLYHRRKDYLMIWYHQYLRVSVIREFFSLFPRQMKQAKEMDYIKDKSKLPDSQKLYFLDKNVAIYGESTNRGKIVRNTVESFTALGLSIPDGFEITDQVLLKGTTTHFDNFYYKFKSVVKKKILRKK